MSKRKKLGNIRTQMMCDIEKIIYITKCIAKKSDSQLESSVLAEVSLDYAKKLNKNNIRIAKLYKL